MVELTFQGILSTPFEPKGITAGKSVYHVPERVFRMSPVYTRFALAPGYYISRRWRSGPTFCAKRSSLKLMPHLAYQAQIIEPCNRRVVCRGSLCRLFWWSGRVVRV